ncbi:hypothetical protein COO60DRAFT_753967 [Scenedesmus sp. NREL 46B-D3]|nr:hypothetical protein COO60DRAFT_753967 [Scenedesmus sp. NREL 46B-D3]
MAATQRSNAALSYKEKLLQPSDQDELSHPDQATELPTLPPTKDEGTPPMTVNVPAPAPAGEDEAATAANAAAGGSAGKPWSPKGNTQSAIDARFKFAHSASGKKGVPKADYEAPIMREGSVSCATQVGVVFPSSVKCCLVRRRSACSAAVQVPPRRVVSCMAHTAALCCRSSARRVRPPGHCGSHHQQKAAHAVGLSGAPGRDPRRLLRVCCVA